MKYILHGKRKSNKKQNINKNVTPTQYISLIITIWNNMEY